MATKIFVNLPVKGLKRSMSFFTAVGFRNNPQFTDETAACMVASDDIYVMLLTHAKFKEFTPRQICDVTKGTELLNCLSCESRGHVDELVRKALASGAAHMPKARTTDSCTSTDSRTPMDTSWSSSTWSRASRSKREENINEIPMPWLSRRETTWSTMSESERDAMLQECSAYDEVLRKSGYFIDGKALQGVQTATTLQFRGGKMTVTDGPFAETKEQLGGVMVLEARDLSHAIQLMSHLPNRRARRIGSVRSRAMGSNTSRPAAPRT